MSIVFKFLGLFLVLLSCSNQPTKINGVSYVASDQKITSTHIKPVVELNANYAAVMPFAFVRNLSHPKVQYNGDKQWYGEREDGVKHYIKELRKSGISIMIKPQLWVWRGEFTGDIKMTSEANWRILEETYSKFILNFVRIAEESKAELFCIGTELELFVKHRPNYWKQLIKDIRVIFSGKLTYAANWDEFKRTPFWETLDYIGVDAYFPVSDAKTPSVEDCLKGWEAHKQVLADYASKYGKPILFTEFGYRSTDYTGKSPWNVDYSIKVVNLEAQANATKALFETFWNQHWFAGGFVWKWFVDHDNVGGIDNSRFTPQNKPAEAVIQDYFLKHRS